MLSCFFQNYKSSQWLQVSLPDKPEHFTGHDNQYMYL